MKNETLTSCSEIAIRETVKFSLVYNWIMYADQHKARFGSMIGSDYVLGESWLQVGLSLRTMLNGELNGLDAGTIDAIIHDCLNANGFTEGKDW